MGSTEIIDVTPEKAAELIRMATVNYVRTRLDGKRVALFAQAMLEGSWDVSPDLLLDRDDRLVDGLNKLTAVILSGTTQRFRLTRLGDDQELLPGFHSGPRFCDVEPTGKAASL